MSQKYVGLDLGTHEVKAVLINAGMRATQILEVVVEPVVARGSGGDEGVGPAADAGPAARRRPGRARAQVLGAVVEPAGARGSGGDEGVGPALDAGLAILRRRGWNHYRVGVC